MLQNAYFLAKIGADTAENEQHFAEILPKTGNYPAGPSWRRRWPLRRRARGPTGSERAAPGCERLRELGSPYRLQEF